MPFSFFSLWYDVKIQSLQTYLSGQCIKSFMHDGFREFIMTCLGFFSMQHLDFLPKIAYIHSYGMKIYMHKDLSIFSIIFFFENLTRVLWSFFPTKIPEYKSHI